MGLGERGKDKVKEAAAPELFRKTEHLTDAHDDIDTKIYTSAKPDIHKTVSPKNHQRKLFIAGEGELSFWLFSESVLFPRVTETVFSSKLLF